MHYILFGMGSEPNVYLLPAFIALLLLLLHILFGLEQNEDSVLNQQTCCAEHHMQMKYEIVLFLCCLYVFINPICGVNWQSASGYQYIQII